MEVREQKPYALWCNKKLNERLEQKIEENLEENLEQKLEENPKEIRHCYFLNTEGFIFSLAPNFTGNVFLRFYGDIKNDNPIGQYYLKTNNEFLRANVLIDSIIALGMKPVEMHLLGEVDVELYIEDGSKILFAREQRPGEVLDNLQVVLESETFKNQDKRKIEYIDLRFGNKVYFKLK